MFVDGVFEAEAGVASASYYIDGGDGEVASVGEGEGVLQTGVDAEAGGEGGGGESVGMGGREAELVVVAGLYDGGVESGIGVAEVGYAEGRGDVVSHILCLPIHGEIGMPPGSGIVGHFDGVGFFGGGVFGGFRGVVGIDDIVDVVGLKLVAAASGGSEHGNGDKSFFLFVDGDAAGAVEFVGYGLPGHAAGNDAQGDVDVAVMGAVLFAGLADEWRTHVHFGERPLLFFTFHIFEVGIYLAAVIENEEVGGGCFLRFCQVLCYPLHHDTL